MEGIIQHNPELQREAEVQSRTICLANGTTVTAISGDYAGAAGSNHGFSSWDELWGYTSESSRRDVSASLQIDGTGAKLLIEALSGRGSYDTDRREKRTVWYHVANAFSLLVSTIASMPSNEQIKVISNYDR